MMNHRPPCLLSDLALQTVAELVRNIGQELIASVCDSAPRKDSSLNKQKIEFLSKLLQNDVPHFVADRVTSRALYAIADVVRNTTCMSYLFTWNGDPQCRHIIEKMIMAALHSHVRVMDFTMWPKFMWPTFCRCLHSMKSLQVLKIHSVSACDIVMKSLIEQDVCFLENLATFVYQGGCSDYLLAQLARFCTKIAHLDVSLSSGLTDISINSLIKMQNLKQLNVSSTNISEDGCYKILTGLPNLESYACSKLSKPEVMVTLCSNLSHVSLSYVTCDLAELAELNNLRELSLCRCNCLTTNLNGLLKTKGSDLKELHLKYVWNVDVFAITKFCTKLRKMSWEVYTFINGARYTLNHNMPHFYVLEHLDVTNFSPLTTDFKPLHYVNIKVLTLHFVFEICDAVIADAVLQNYLKYLEELRLYNCGSLSLKTVRKLLQHCDDLKVLGGVATWIGVSAQELEKFKTEVRLNNINISIE